MDDGGKNVPMTTIRQARTYASLAAAAALTASAGLGAGVGVTNGTTAGIVAGLVAAATTVFGAVGGVRLLVRCPEHV